jgi:Glyoxalase-like domain
MARLADVVIDCARPSVVARFWAETLDGYAVAPYDADELARLRAIGIDDPEDDPTVLVEGDPDSPRLWFQRVPEAKVVKNRVHVDLHADDLEAEVGRLVGLGARVLHPERDGLVVMADVEGNEFCVATGEVGPPGRGHR